MALEPLTPAPSPIPFDEFSRRLLTLYRPPLRARSTYQRMAQLVGLLSDSGIATTFDLTADRLAAWIAARSQVVSINTVIGELGYLQTACQFAVEEGGLARNPFVSRRLRLRKVMKVFKTHHTLKEVSTVLSFLRERSKNWNGLRLHALVSTVAYTGMRRNEALYLRTEDLNLGDRMIAIVPRGANRLKTVAAGQPVPVCEELAEVLAEWLPEVESDWLFPTISRESPWTGGNPGTKPLDRLKQAGQACGVEGLTFLSLRHSWATHAETAWGLSDPAIQRILRHTTPLTSRHYRHADAANLRAIVRAVSYRDRPEPDAIER